MDRLIIILPWIQIALSALLVASILMQARGSGVGGSFGGSSAVYRTRRGIEKTLFRGTLVLAILFSGVALFRLLI